MVKNNQIPIGQAKKAVGREQEEIERIRARASYSMFEELYDFLEPRPCTANILRKFYDILNSKCSFGSRKNAEYAEESLNWLLKDKGVL
jgi:hypothetical protein